MNHVTISTVPVHMNAKRDLKVIFAQQNVVLMNTDETVRTYAAISVITMKLVIPSLEIVADVLTVIKMHDATKNAIMEPMERIAHTNVGNVLIL